MTDYLSSTLTPSSPRRPGAQRAVAPIAAAAALVIVVAGGALAFQALDGGGEQPERWAPPSTFAFAKLDLDPPAGQKVAAYRFSRHFPDAPRAADADELLDRAVDQALSGAELDYEREVKPWLGDRVAIAAFGPGDDPGFVGIVQHTDADEAEASLRRAAAEDPFGFQVLDGYVVVGETQGVVDMAVRASRDGGLDGVKRFQDDVDELDGDAIVTGWVDVEQAGRLAEEAGGQVLPFGGAGPLSQSTGRLVFAVRADPDHIELEGKALDVPEQAAADDAGALLAGLPADTMAALSFAGLAETLTQQFEDATAQFPELEDAVAEIEENAGVQLPEDIVTVLGDRAVVAGNWVDGEPEIGFRSHPDDRDAAKEVVERVLPQIPLEPFDVVDAGDGDLVVAYGQGYGQRLAEDGDLGDSDLAKEALVDLDSASAAIFVDVQSIARAFFGTSDHDDAGGRNLRPIKAIGMTSHVDGDEQEFRLRVVAKG